MRRVLSRGSAALLLFLVALTAGAARAQVYDGYRAERSRPPASAGDGLAMPLPRTLGDLAPAFGLVVDYTNQPLLARSSYGGQAGAVVSHRVIAHVVAALGVTDRVELHVRAPLVFQAGDAPVISEVAFAAPDTVSFADGVLGGSVRILGDGAGASRGLASAGAGAGRPAVSAAGVSAAGAWRRRLRVTSSSTSSAGPKAGAALPRRASRVACRLPSAALRRSAPCRPAAFR